MRTRGWKNLVCNPVTWRRTQQFILVCAYLERGWLWSNRAGNERSLQYPHLAPVARSPQQGELGAHAAARRQQHQFRRHHSGLPHLHRKEKSPVGLSEESSVQRILTYPGAQIAYDRAPLRICSLNLRFVLRI